MAALIDEASRCRPDLQNKLFPVIHEKRVQGIWLEMLFYPWADEISAHNEDPEPKHLSRTPMVCACPWWRLRSGKAFYKADRARVRTHV